jgi:hypothetical protein
MCLKARVLFKTHLTSRNVWNRGKKANRGLVSAVPSEKLLSLERHGSLFGREAMVVILERQLRLAALAHES